MQLVKLVGYGATILSLAVSSGVAYADNDAHNDTTGPDSTNEVEVEIDNDLDIDVDKDADFDADLDLDFSTGWNDVKDNTTAGDNTSGSVDAKVNGSLTIDQSGDDLCECFGNMFEGGDNNASNQLTGPDSTNEAEIEIKNDVDVDVDKDADVDFDVDVDADTGDNKTEHNTTAGDTSSGNVDFEFDWDVTIIQ